MFSDGNKPFPATKLRKLKDTINTIQKIKYVGMYSYDVFRRIVSRDVLKFCS